MAESERLICPTCGKTFSRIDHLRRHTRSHNSSRPYKCSACGKSYARRDVQKRHYESCPNRSLQLASEQTNESEDIPAPHFSKFRAFKVNKNLTKTPSPAQDDDDDDELFLSRIEDDLAALTPGEWEAAEQLVVYQNSPSTSATQTILDPDMFFLDLWGPSATELFVTQDPVTSFSFLVRFTAGLGLKAAYEDPVGKLEELFDLDAPHNGYTESDVGSLDVPPQSISLHSPQDSEHNGSDGSLGGCRTTHIGCMSYSAAMALLPKHLDTNTLIGKCHEIVADLKHAQYTLRQADPSSASANDAVAAQFFSPARLLSCLDYYWSEWHPNLPIVHRPMFVATSGPTHLLAAMAVIGARYSPCDMDQHQGKLLYNVVEQLVFYRLDTLADYPAQTSRLQRQYVQTLQAACIVVIYQSKDGETRSRYHSRRQRMSQMIEAAHRNSNRRARHPDFRNIGADIFDWRGYIETEELIRVFHWCFVIDAAFVTFYNLPPRSSLRDLTMGLLSPETCFEALTAQSCLFELQKWQYQTEYTSEMSLHSSLRLFCHAEMDFAAQVRFAHQSPFTLFCIVSAFHIMLFNIDADIASLTQYDPLLTGLNNWRAVWNRSSIIAMDSDPRGSIGVPRQKQGYWKHGAEYWLLAHVYLQQIINANTVGSPPSSDALVVRSRSLEFDESSQSRLHNFVQAYRSGFTAI